MNKFLYWVSAVVFGLLTPSMWLRNHRTDQALDEWFRECLSEGVHFTNIGRCTARLKGVEVWIANHPYASFTVDGSGLPSRLTVYRLQKLLMRSRVEQFKSKHSE